MLTLGRKTLSVPILQGGMGVGVSLGGLAGAVAACGGMGCISTADAGYREPDFARDPASANHRALTAEIKKAKQIAVESKEQQEETTQQMDMFHIAETQLADEISKLDVMAMTPIEALQTLFELQKKAKGL